MIHGSLFNHLVRELKNAPEANFIQATPDREGSAPVSDFALGRGGYSLFLSCPGAGDFHSWGRGIRGSAGYSQDRGFFVEPGDILESATKHTKRAGYFIAHGTSREEAVDRAVRVVDSIHIETEK